MKGVYTALVTPFCNGEIDFHSLENIIRMQVQSNIDGLVVLGTTGESPVISDIEKEAIIKLSTKYSSKDFKIIVGIGTNNTKSSIDNAIKAESLGADAVLVVNPYYNLPSQDGMYEHFIKIADSINIPMLLYNIESRSGVNIEVETLSRLFNHKNIVGIKECSSNFKQIIDILLLPEKPSLFSGDDLMVYPMMCIGAQGIISVLSNIFPAEVKEMVSLLTKGEFIKAKKIYIKFYDLMRTMVSVGVNPVPIKTLLAYKGYINEEYRLPIVGLDDNQKIILINKYKNIFNE